MTQIFRKLNEIVTGKYDSYKTYDSIAYDEESTSSKDTQASFNPKARGNQIVSLLEIAKAKGNAFVDALPDNNPNQK